MPWRIPPLSLVQALITLCSFPPLSHSLSSELFRSFPCGGVVASPAAGAKAATTFPAPRLVPSPTEAIATSSQVRISTRLHFLSDISYSQIGGLATLSHRLVLARLQIQMCGARSCYICMVLLLKFALLAVRR
jgi:hypothetical protein